MTDPSRDPSVFEEPHLRGGRSSIDPSEARAETDERAERSVWDEPGLSPELAGPPAEGDVTYARWLEGRARETTLPASWLVTLGVALAAGPWAVIGAFLGGGESIPGVFAMVVFGPVLEEVAKVAVMLYVVEKRPFVFRSAAQIAVCALAGGAVFAVIENVVYLNVYIPQPSAGVVRWRWTVCVAMHVGCSFVAGLGLVRIWRDVWERKARARTTLGYPYLVAAAAIHGTYNAFALVLQAADYGF